MVSDFGALVSRRRWRLIPSMSVIITVQVCLEWVGFAQEASVLNLFWLDRE
jgi:hypothetical protein